MPGHSLPRHAQKKRAAGHSVARFDVIRSVIVRLSSGYRPVKFAWPAALGTVRGAGFGFGIGLDLSAELASFGTGHFTSGFHGK